MRIVFDYYLDAWNYCRTNRIALDSIHKLNFRKWYVEYKEFENV
jgi:phage-related protein